ncbi:TetR/AcrR family transcriptional regulator [Calidifontibacter sp. DB0510]|uniref:TetR/AcrR family transcriptional regulator n=1 Tax=Metallococcus carri TaxID=1656884 RepID=A0A967E9F7_9MICO|nr:TetR/AcrR family transcriptional regulator [Metallococcus carri]NHN55140.1 TetR/AcrR family transcriptional regulator [Metallococcus carri]NOP36217.1 TetR/AcrR family transcriptional regulator [Calidifontibacter sp. DB2511S]
MPTPSRLLPVAGPPTRVRRDAAANSDRILCAAVELVQSEGVDAITMDRVAERAGVGKGTVFRAFGSRSGLLAALTDETERDFQRGMLQGAPPLGPGAAPLDRLLAFGEGRLRLHAVHGQLFREIARTPTGKYDVPARQVSMTHVRMLLRQLGVDAHLEVLSEALVGTLDADVVSQLLERGLSEAELIAGWRDLVLRLVGGCRP